MGKSKDEKNILSRIFGSFARGANSAPETSDAATSVIETEIEKRVGRINSLYGTKMKLRGLHTEELEKKDSIEHQLRELDAQRVEALTAYRISKNENDNKRAADLLEQIEPLKREMADISAVANAIAQKIADLNEPIKEAERGYRIDLGKFFDTQMDGLVAEYNDIAPEFARIVTNIDALQKTMIEYQSGNSNGWWRDARAPTIKPRDGHIYSPIMDTTSREFDSVSQRRALELIAAFKEGGFMSRFDK